MASKFKIGDKAVPTSRDECGTFEMEEDAAYVVITDVLGSDYHYGIYNKEDKKIDSCWRCLDDTNLKPYKKTLDNLEVGDVLVHTNGDERKVLAVCGQLVFLSKHDDFDAYDVVNTAKYWEFYSWKVKTEEPKDSPTELTVGEISERLGFEVKVVKEQS